MRIGVDVGGMSVKVGIVNEQGEITSKKVITTEIGDQNSFVGKVGDLVNEILTENNISKSQIKGIGVGCPGSVSTLDGVVKYSENIKWVDCEVKRILEEKTGITTYVGNDADCATIGEVKFGIAKGYTDVIMITVGTGIGGGIVVNGGLYTGYKGMAGELGHTTLVYNGVQCACGRKGCYEKYASATGLIRITKEYMQTDTAKNSLMWTEVGGDIEKVNGITSFKCAKNGDILANMVVEKYIEYLSEGLLNYCNIFRPQAIVLGGAISNEGKYLTDKVVRYLEDRVYGYGGTPKVEILTAKLKNDAGIIGASALV